MVEPKRSDDLSLLDPKFGSLVQKMLSQAWSEWLHPYVFEAKRSKERQFRLFGFGRTKEECVRYGVPAQYANPYTVYPVRRAKKTWTVDSRHMSWRAVDIVFDSDPDPKKRQPSWNGNYKRLIEIAKTLWIRNLAPRELCHFEL
jgi:hypothetical protein